MRVIIQVWTEGVNTFSSIQRGDKDFGPRKLNAKATRHLLSLADFLERTPKRRKKYGPRLGPSVQRSERWAAVVELCQMDRIERGGLGRVAVAELAQVESIGMRRAEAYLQVAASRGQLTRLGDGVYEMVAAPVASEAAE